MIDLNNVTLISVSGLSDTNSFNKILKAMKYSMSGLNYGDIKLLTANRTYSEQNDIKIIQIPELTYEEYNKFIVFELFKYVDTTHALIVQDDGFVINHKLWNPIFTEFDYIGAAFPLPRDNFSYRDRRGEIFRVGNGGFSLRSKKLLKLATELNLNWEPFHGYFNEDGWFCANHRHTYEENGCLFAPIEIAVHFSQEADIPEANEILPFGFHGKWSKFNPNF